MIEAFVELDLARQFGEILDLSDAYEFLESLMNQAFFLSLTH
jgi:hypothetical protein